MALIASSCGGSASGNNPPPPPPAPSISSFTPSSGLVGAMVTITGANLNGATAVSFNGKSATITADTATQITVTVPAGASTGKVTVTTSGGSATSSGSFTVMAPAPTITSFSPASGLVGASVSITGTNLTGASAVSFNGTAASFTVASDTQINTTVPANATNGKIAVTTPGGTANSTGNFTVTPPAPTISSFTPASGSIGASVTITGTNFTGASAVSFNGKAATFTVNSPTQISATVPAAATTGKISVTTPGGTATSASNFTVNVSSSTLDLTIDGLYITQATQNYPAPAVPLVKDRSAWVRVFVMANQTNTAAPQVRVRFINGATTNTLTINASATSVPTSLDLENATASWNAAVSSAWIQPGTQVIADVDPTGVIPESDKTNNSFTANLDVRTLKPWKVTLIPVHTGDGRTGGVNSGNSATFVDSAKRLHPVPDAIDVLVGSTMNSSVNTLSSSGGSTWSTVLSEVDAKRTADGATDRYYYGVVKLSYTSGVVGLGYVGHPAAIGWDVTGSAPGVLAHEVGHNFGRQHSPCGGAGSPDPNYPYAGGLIGVPGWDAFASSNNLKVSSTYTDIMGYCGNQWVSDYVYKSVLNFRAASSIGAPVPGGAGAAQTGLLIWGRIEDEKVILEPAFQVRATGATPTPGPFRWEARDAFGQTLAAVSFDAHEIADLPGGSAQTFSFVVPMNAATLQAVQSHRIVKENREVARQFATAAADEEQPIVQELPNHSVQVYWNAASHPVVMLRDARTGEVRGFLRGGIAQVDEPPADLEMQFSDGVRSRTVSHHRLAD